MLTCVGPLEGSCMFPGWMPVTTRWPLEPRGGLGGCRRGSGLSCWESKWCLLLGPSHPESPTASRTFLAQTERQGLQTYSRRTTTPGTSTRHHFVM